VLKTCCVKTLRSIAGRVTDISGDAEIASTGKRKYGKYKYKKEKYVRVENTSTEKSSTIVQGRKMQVYGKSK